MNQNKECVVDIICPNCSSMKTVSFNEYKFYSCMCDGCRIEMMEYSISYKNKWAQTQKEKTKEGDPWDTYDYSW